MSNLTIERWADIGPREMLFAYRKAKADCFFERVTCASRMFCEYETDLPKRLQSLCTRINQGGIGELLSSNLGSPKVMAKKLALKLKQEVSNGRTTSKLDSEHAFFSSSSRAFSRLLDTHELVPEFRLIGHFPVEMHILSALWINHVGHKFDGALTSAAFGSRVRRYGAPPYSERGQLGDYHLEANGSFEPYFEPYKAWRELGLKAIRRTLNADGAVIAASMDLTSYYHRIHPSFIFNRTFLKNAGIELTNWEFEFTMAVGTALAGWSDLIKEHLKQAGAAEAEIGLGGLPIGLSLVRIISNALLCALDRDIQQGLSPIYYGRYVDDIFLVLSDPGNLRNADDFLSFVAARTTLFPEKATPTGQIDLRLPPGVMPPTSLVLQKSKQKLFFLQGQAGIDLLENIESEIRSVSSERRLMPSPDSLEDMASAKVLTAAAQATEEADSLRRADGLAIRRMGWAIQLRAVETIARDLRQDDWRAERTKFYDFAHNHIIRPDRILDHLDYLPRLLELAVALGDWSAACALYSQTLVAVDKLREVTGSREIKLNGFSVHAHVPAIWDGLKESIRESSAHAIARSLSWSKGEVKKIPTSGVELCSAVGLGNSYEEVARFSQQLRECDLAKTAYKDHLQRDASRERPNVEGEEVLAFVFPHIDDLRDFLTSSGEHNSYASTARINARCKAGGNGETPSLLPYLFSTRPYSAQEISLFLPDRCVFGRTATIAAQYLARYVRAVRGVWVWESLADSDIEIEILTPSEPREPRLAVIKSRESGSKVLLGISSLLTTEDAFNAAANGLPDLSPARYKRLKTIVDYAVNSEPRPAYLLLPELSLPERWLDTVSGLLRNAGISLIAGLDYRHVGSAEIYSEAVLVLSDERLGFPSTVQIRQPKSLPAPHEEETLLHKFGKKWASVPGMDTKAIYVHGGLCFGVLVCSELQNVAHRSGFQGRIDALMVLSWNQDLETFSSLVESGSLDVHAYIALVNNRKYGDSRVRVPAKVAHARDVCRLRGGENEHVVVAKIDVHGLREFQSRDRRWPKEDDPFKPVPEGFKISARRKTSPK